MSSYSIKCFVSGEGAAVISLEARVKQISGSIKFIGNAKKKREFNKRKKSQMLTTAVQNKLSKVPERPADSRIKTENT